MTKSGKKRRSRKIPPPVASSSHRASGTGRQPSPNKTRHQKKHKSDGKSKGKSDDQKHQPQHSQDDPRQQEQHQQPEPPQRPQQPQQGATAKMSATKKNLKETFDDIHEEMQLFEHSKTSTGQYKKNLSRKESLVRTKKLKVMRKRDQEDMAIFSRAGQRLRGSKAAVQEDIIDGSFVFQPPLPGSKLTTATMADVDDSDVPTRGLSEDEINAEGCVHAGITRHRSRQGTCVEDDDSSSGDENDGDSDGTDGPGADDDDESGEDDAGDVEGTTKSQTNPVHEDKADRMAQQRAKVKAKPSKRTGPLTKKKRRQMYRLKNFQSQRMAKRLGEAVGAHARGEHKLAIEMLKQVANDAPSAPQVYSSLGTVYDDMLRKSRAHEEELASMGLAADEEIMQKRNANIAEQLHLAKKLYGSFHVAAVLCKKDFTLWVRAADAAHDIASIHNRYMVLKIPGEDKQFHVDERKRWLSEALRDYRVAENLKPPGIDIPAKLATVHMELGSISDALAMLTDLKNKQPIEFDADEGDEGERDEPEGTPATQPRNEFQSSSKAWMLYSELMLRIGFECNRWNDGIQIHTNYMFRRWLRKFSSSFDWRERRLQALVMAMEAAIGSKSAARLIQWMRRRVIANIQRGEQPTDLTKWHIDERIRDSKADGGHGGGGSVNSNKGGDSDVSGKMGKRSLGADAVADESGSHKKDGDNEDSDSTNGTNVETPDTNAPNENLDQEEELLITMNEAELQAFDRTTNEIEDDVDASARAHAREKLLQQQRNALNQLEGNEGQSKDITNTSQDNTDNADITQSEIQTSILQAPLPTTGSCREACEIAIQLVRHCMSLNEYEGGELVCEAVAVYFKERARLSDRRVEKLRRAERRALQVSQDIFGISGQAQEHDEDDLSDIDDDELYISDDELLDARDDNDIVQSLRRGVLPPEIQVLYGACLAHRHDRTFLATNCIKSFHHLRDMTKEYLLQEETDVADSAEPAWTDFCVQNNGELLKTDALAIVGSALEHMNKESEWAPRLAGVFIDYFHEIRKAGVLNLAIEKEPGSTVHWRIEQAVQVMFSSCRMTIAHAIETSSVQPNFNAASQDSNSSNNHNHNYGDQHAQGKCLDAFDSMATVVDIIWRILDDAVLSNMTAEMLRIFREGSTFLSRVDARSSMEAQRKFFNHLLMMVSKFCGLRSTKQLAGPIDPKTNGAVATGPLVVTAPPMSATWQTDDQRALSLRVYNLCVGWNVSHFSGWESEEFNFRLLKQRDGPKYFRISVTDGQVSGSLPIEFEDELCCQWKEIQSLCPDLCEMEIEQNLASIREVRDSNLNADATRQMEEAASDDEENGLYILLQFSSYCIRLAKEADDEIERSLLVRNALSVLFPMSQFVLNVALWDSSIGHSSDDTDWMDSWQRFANGKHRRVSTTSSRKRKERSRKSLSSQGATNTATRRLRRGFLSIPADELLNVWNASIEEGSTEASDGTAAATAATAADTCGGRSDDEMRAFNNGNPSDEGDSMRTVDNAIRQLRGCFTEVAVEKASLNVAIAMLDVARRSDCYNPFLCLQHAAMFASQAAKSGTNDERFRRPTPDANDCTPADALLVLGRADCLQCIHFVNEATFLCKYVARVCMLHRDRSRPKWEWNSRWKIVSILAYNTAFMILSSVRGLLDRVALKNFHDMWTPDVIDELERAYCEGSVWFSRFKMTRTNGNANNPATEIGEAGDDFNEGSDDKEVHGADHHSHDSNEHHDSNSSNHNRSDDESLGDVNAHTLGSSVVANSGHQEQIPDCGNDENQQMMVLDIPHFPSMSSPSSQKSPHEMDVGADDRSEDHAMQVEAV